MVEVDYLTVTNVLTIGADVDLYCGGTNQLRLGANDYLKITGTYYGSSVLADGGLSLGGDIQINKATPNIIMNATSGSPDILFKENGTTKMSCGYWTDVDQFHVYDNTGQGKALLTLNHSGQLALPVSGSSGGIVIGETIHLYRNSDGFLTIDPWTLHKNDVVCYGFFGSDTDPAKQSGGGAILIGSAFTSACTPPEINLTDAQLSYAVSSSPPSPQRMRDIWYKPSTGTYYVNAPASYPGTNWVAFQGPTGSRPTSNVALGQFYTDTTTGYIYTNNHLGDPDWVAIGPHMGTSFTGFDTLFLLKSALRNRDGSYESDTAYYTANLYLKNLYATGTIYYHSGAPTSFDSMDDLAVLKEIKSTTDDKGNEIIDPETLNHLKSESGFYDTAKMDGWHICVEKRLLDRIEKLENQLSKIINGVKID
jgi:hypothetical protein